MTRSEAGQATLELALCLPVVALLIAGFVEVGFWVGDRTRVIHAAREAARIAAVDPEFDRIRRAAEDTGLEGVRVSVDPEREERIVGEAITVTVNYPGAPKIPFAGSIFRPRTLEASAVMRIETP